MKNCVQRPLAAKLRWRRIRLAITPRYLVNHASQIKISPYITFQCYTIEEGNKVIISRHTRLHTKAIR